MVGFPEIVGTNAVTTPTQDFGLVDVGISTGNFELGWAKAKDKNKSGKKVKGKGLDVQRGDKEPERGPKIGSWPKNGCWTRLTTWANGEGDHVMHVVESGSKRKNNVESMAESNEGEREKKLKVDEEARSLSILFATHLGAAEVAKQPRQDQ